MHGRLARGLYRVPGAELRKERSVARADGIDAGIETRRRGFRLTFAADQRHVHARQRARERRAHQAAAGDRHVELPFSLHAHTRSTL